MFKLKQEITRAVQLLELVKNREKTKNDLLKVTVDIFKKRCEIGDFDGVHSREFSDTNVVQNLRYGVEEKRRHIEDEAAQLYDKLNKYTTDEEAQCSFPFKRKKHYRYSCRKLNSCLGLSRRRVGRGGSAQYSCGTEPGGLEPVYDDGIWNVLYSLDDVVHEACFTETTREPTSEARKTREEQRTR
eukprot:sb/3471384/